MAHRDILMDLVASMLADLDANPALLVSGLPYTGQRGVVGGALIHAPWCVEVSTGMGISLTHLVFEEFACQWHSCVDEAYPRLREQACALGLHENTRGALPHGGGVVVRQLWAGAERWAHRSVAEACTWARELSTPLLRRKLPGETGRLVAEVEEALREAVVAGLGAHERSGQEQATHLAWMGSRQRSGPRRSAGEAEVALACELVRVSRERRGWGVSDGLVIAIAGAALGAVRAQDRVSLRGVDLATLPATLEVADGLRRGDPELGCAAAVKLARAALR